MQTLDDQIAHVQKRIAAVTNKETQQKNRRVNLEGRLKTLHQKQDARRDDLILAHAKGRLENDPGELEEFRNRLNAEQRKLFDLPAKGNGATGRDAPDPATDTASDAAKPANSVQDTAPAEPMSPAPARASEPAPAEPMPPEPARASEPAPAEPMPPEPARASEPAPAEPEQKATAKQITFLKALIVQHPDAAQRLGIDIESLSSMSRRKASWAIKTLKA